MHLVLPALRVPASHLQQIRQGLEPHALAANCGALSNHKVLYELYFAPHTCIRERAKLILIYYHGIVNDFSQAQMLCHKFVVLGCLRDMLWFV